MSNTQSAHTPARLSFFAFVALASACGAAPEALPDDERPEMNEDAVVLAEGSFAPKMHQASGGVRIEDAAGSRRMLFMDDFEIENGPALKVFLSPLSFDDLTPEVALEGRVVLGDLAALAGLQDYAIGADIEVDAFQSVVVWCEQFAILYAGAALDPVTAE